jgi:hypothetical protein
MMWQKFTEHTLRNDEARFNLEVRCSNSDDLTAWLYATVQLIFEHDALLARAWEQSLAGKTASPKQLQEQLSLACWLQPGRYLDRRTPITPQELNVAVYYGERYYLIPVSPATTLAKLNSCVEQILAAPSETGDATVEKVLGQSPRHLQASLRKRLPHETQEGLKALQTAPILLNWNLQSSQKRLRDIRNASRGGNDHPLVLFRTESSIVFDISHVMFDGMWAKHIADVMTKFAEGVERIPAAKATAPLQSLRLLSGANFPKPTRPLEVCAEADGIRLRDLQALRRKLAQQGLRVTVNDFLIWARFEHSRRYQPGPRAREVLAQAGPELAAQIQQGWEEERRILPSLMVLVDIGKADPRLRLFSTTIQSTGMEDLAALSSTVQEKIAVARHGKSFSSVASQLLVWTPSFLRPFGTWASEKVSFLLDRIQADEVFSNLGHVGAESSITRFASARGSVRGQTRVWGFLSTSDDVLYVTLRDFLPYVKQLPPEQAQVLTQDFLDSYVETVNALIDRPN